MNKKSKIKIEFVSLLLDDEFVNRVIAAIDSAAEMNELVQKYSDQQDTFQYAVEFIRHVLNDNNEMKQSDHERILKSIHESLKTQKVSLFHRFILNNHLWKVAAIFIILLAISIGIYEFSNLDSLSKIAQKEIPIMDNGVIILSDGTVHKLKENDNFVEYTQKGTEVILKSKGLSEVKLRNKLTSNILSVNQIVVPFGHRINIKLSDGTLAFLNAGSKLVLPIEFGSKTREVYLKGEGYFEVKKNQEKPFIVKTDHIDIQVLGTVFNVSAYNNDQTVSVVLVEGKVNVSQKNKIFKNSTYILHPGQGCFYSVKNLNAIVKEVDPEDFILWKDGLCRFYNQPLKNIVNQLKKYYNINVMIDNNILANTIVNGKLVLPERSEDAIDLLTKTLEATYKRINKTTYLIKEKKPD